MCPTDHDRRSLFFAALENVYVMFGVRFWGRGKNRTTTCTRNHFYSSPLLPARRPLPLGLSLVTMFRTLPYRHVQLSRALATHAIGTPSRTANPVTRHDWKKVEIQEIYDTPLLDLVFQSASVHRQHHDPSKIQLCTLMNIKSALYPRYLPLFSFNLSLFSWGMHRRLSAFLVLESIETITFCQVLIAPNRRGIQHLQRHQSSWRSNLCLRRLARQRKMEVPGSVWVLPGGISQVGSEDSREFWRWSARSAEWAWKSAPPSECFLPNRLGS